MNYIVHIRTKRKNWRFCKIFDCYVDAYDFVVKPKTYLYNGRYNSSKQRFYRISSCYNSDFYVIGYFVAFPCIFNDKSYKFNHIEEITYDDILKHE